MLLTKNKSLHLLSGALTTFNFLALKLLLKNPAKAKTYPGRVFREYMSLVGHDQWASKDIFEIIPVQGIRIVIEHLEGQGVGTPIDELAYLAMITRYVKPLKVFEIGTFRGRTALNFALNSPEDCFIYTLDLPPEGKTNHLAGKYAADNTMILQSSNH